MVFLSTASDDLTIVSRGRGNVEACSTSQSFNMFIVYLFSIGTVERHRSVTLPPTVGRFEKLYDMMRIHTTFGLQSAATIEIGRTLHFVGIQLSFTFVRHETVRERVKCAIAVSFLRLVSSFALRCLSRPVAPCLECARGRTVRPASICCICEQRDVKFVTILWRLNVSLRLSRGLV